MQPDLADVAPLDYNLATRVSVGDALTRSALMFPTRTAISDADGDIDYRELDSTSNALARALRDTGIQRQRPVAIMMDNSWKFIATYFACAKSALVALPINTALAPADIAWILHDAEVSAIVVDYALLPLLEDSLGVSSLSSMTIMVAGAGEEAVPASVAGQGTAVWEEVVASASAAAPAIAVEDRDTVQCLYTSGTTSNPKGVLVSHVSVFIAGMTNALQLGHEWGRGHSTLINVLPLFHTTGLNTLTLPVLFTGGRVILHKRFDATAVLDAIERHRVTHTLLLPIMYRALLAETSDEPRDLTSMTHALYAMAPIPDSLLRQVCEMLPNAAVILGSGQTEVVPVTVLQWSEHRDTKASSWGPAALTVETEILDDSGSVLGPGETGEITYRGPNVSSGYWNNAAANRSAFAHGRFHSGDIGYLDDQRVFWFTDRLKDIVKSGGENVSSVHVERVVTAAPGVAECSIVGVPHERWGEAVCAVVVPVDPDIDHEELSAQVIAHSKAKLSGFEVPKRVVVVDALPKTATGKTRKHELRKLLNAPK